MSGKVLISPSELSDLMKAEPVVLIDTRDPAIYAEAIEKRALIEL